MPYVYILECSDRSFYVGSTARYPARRTPVRLVYIEQLDRIDEAYAREKQVQGWGRAKRIALIEGRLADLSGLSASRSRENRDLDELDQRV